MLVFLVRSGIAFIVFERVRMDNNFSINNVRMIKKGYTPVIPNKKKQYQVFEDNSCLICMPIVHLFQINANVFILFKIG